MTVNRIGPVSCAKIAVVIYGAAGLLIGAVLSCIALLGVALSGLQPDIAGKAMPPFIGAIVGVGAIIVCPIIYGAIGFVSALIGAWLYNLVASKVGGIELDIS